ncbi:MAG: hypothetical protein KJ718_06375 [Nanoarchaeota archaeon]|nr:hypothetical protein [Nanoarchaeota archaeon]MBU1052143.1 hypothetical protein [Nanoarchaeota archaeon]MBU1988578.1 hypothetical protein [Nanoarchaeota archaeon]
MAKVIIYEDEEKSVCRRYKGLLEGHDVHLRLCWLGRADLHFLMEQGFPEQNIRNEFGDSRQEKADVYFVDGLDGECFDILPKLPKKCSFLHSGNERIRDEARRQGYQVLEEDAEPEEAIQQALSR